MSKISFSFSSRLIEQSLRTGAVHKKTEVIDGLPDGYHLVAASVINGVLELEFGNWEAAPTSRSVTFKTLNEPEAIP